MKRFNNLRLSTDGADSSSLEPDPLSTPVGDIDISRPVAKPGNIEFTITEAKVVDKKDDATRKNVMFKVKSTRENKSTKNEVMPPGSLVLSKYMPTAETDKMTRKQVGQSFARLCKGIGLPASITPADVINNPSVLVGKTGLWKVKKKDETAEYAEGNELGDVVVPE